MPASIVRAEINRTDGPNAMAVAVAHGVSFDPGREFRPSGHSSPLAVRLSFSSAKVAQIDEGVRRLARAWTAYRSRL